jgi:hypothetical protein
LYSSILGYFKFESLGSIEVIIAVGINANKGVKIKEEKFLITFLQK